MNANDMKTREELVRAIQEMTRRMVARFGVTCSELPALAKDATRDDMRRWSNVVGVRIGALYGDEYTRESAAFTRIERARLILIEKRDIDTEAAKRIADERAAVGRLASYRYRIHCDDWGFAVMLETSRVGDGARFCETQVRRAAMGPTRP